MWRGSLRSSFACGAGPVDCAFGLQLSFACLNGTQTPSSSPPLDASTGTSRNGASAVSTLGGAVVGGLLLQLVALLLL